MLNKSKWKGGTLRIEVAKESFLHRCGHVGVLVMLSQWFQSSFSFSICKIWPKGSFVLLHVTNTAEELSSQLLSVNFKAF